ncbi:MAG: BT_3928 family protein [Rikenellaceae bacterium]
MRFLRGFSRILLGLTFIFSGFTKIIDPVGVGLIFAEYFKIIGLAAAPGICQIMGIVLSSVELLLGISLLLGIRMKVIASVTLILVSFFTITTFFLAIFNPIHDCGCFGEAVKLTNWQSFYKNIILFICALIIYRQRDIFVPIAPTHWEWILISLYALAVVTVSVYCYRHLPLIDFTDYKAGKDLRENVILQKNEDQPVFETVLIYKKGNTIKEFSIENLPDSSWTFVDSRSKQVNNTVEPKSGTFAISDRNGEYITDSILSYKGALFITSIPYLERLDQKIVKKIVERDTHFKSMGIKHIILTGSSFESVDEIFGNIGDLVVYYSDYKTLITLNRSNGGLVYLYDGQISAKWSHIDADRLNIESVIKEDPEIISAKKIIKEHVTVEVFIALLLLVIFLMRLILRITYKPNLKKDEDCSRV